MSDQVVELEVPAPAVETPPADVDDLGVGELFHHDRQVARL